MAWGERDRDPIPLRVVLAALWRDRVVPAAVLLVALLTTARAVFTSPAPQAAVGLVHDIPLLLVAIVVFWHRARESGSGGRRFWELLAAAYVCWLAVRLWEVGPARGPAWDPATGIVRDLIFLGFYVCLVVALELHPERRRGDESELDRSLRSYRALAAAIFAFALLVYFALLPGRFNAREYATRVPSFLFYAALDLYAAVRLAVLRWNAQDPRWRAVYGWLLATAVVWVLGDGSSALGALGVSAAAYGPPVFLALQLDFLAVLAAARIQGLPPFRRLPPAATSFQLERRSAREGGFWGGPLLVYLVALPVLHFTLTWSGALDPATHGARELLLLAAIVGLAALTFVYQRLLTRESERLAREAQDRGRQAQRLQALGQLAAGIAHDFNNLLTVILGSAAFIRRGLAASQERLRADVDEIERSVRRGADMVRRLIAFGRQPEAEGAGKRPVDLQELVLELSRTLRRLLPEHIAIQVDDQGLTRPVAADAAAVEEILLNLATNARDAMTPLSFAAPGRREGRLRITVGAVRFDEARCARQGWGAPGDYGVLAVSDTGTGMDEEVRRRLFEPFFTTKKNDEGSGLGMAMVADLVRLARGGIEVATAPGEGTTVTVYLPLATRRSPAGHEAEPAPLPQGGGETILVVEDEAVIRTLAQRTLESCGYRVLTAADGLEGLRVYREHAGVIAVVVSDVVMPRMGGPELYEAVRREGASGRVRFIFTTGYTDREVAAHGAIDPSLPRLHKPWAVDDLIGKVREVLERSLDGAA